jgi:hypothetical protein
VNSAGERLGVHRVGNDALEFAANAEMFQIASTFVAQ